MTRIAETRSTPEVSDSAACAKAAPRLGDIAAQAALHGRSGEAASRHMTDSYALELRLKMNALLVESALNVQAIAADKAATQLGMMLHAYDMNDLELADALVNSFVEERIGDRAA